MSIVSENVTLKGSKLVSENVTFKVKNDNKTWKKQKTLLAFSKGRLV